MKIIFSQFGLGVILFFVLRFLISLMSSFPSAFIINAETTAIVSSIIVLTVVIILSTITIVGSIKH